MTSVAGRGAGMKSVLSKSCEAGDPLGRHVVAPVRHGLVVVFRRAVIAADAAVAAVPPSRREIPRSRAGGPA